MLIMKMENKIRVSRSLIPIYRNSSRFSSLEIEEDAIAVALYMACREKHIIGFFWNFLAHR